MSELTAALYRRDASKVDVHQARHLAQAPLQPEAGRSQPLIPVVRLTRLQIGDQMACPVKARQRQQGPQWSANITAQTADAATSGQPANG